MGLAPAVAVIMGFAAIYLGCRGFQARGIVLWDRSGAETRITGWPGRALGMVLILLGGALIWSGLSMATLER